MLNVRYLLSQYPSKGEYLTLKVKIMRPQAFAKCLCFGIDPGFFSGGGGGTRSFTQKILLRVLDVSLASQK